MRNLKSEPIFGKLAWLKFTLTEGQKSQGRDGRDKDQTDEDSLYCGKNG